MATIPSIAMIPSGYKASKLYSVLPTDGTGDFTFSRAGALPSYNATRVNSEGLIEEVLSNVPRLNYPLIDGVVSGCPSLLLEPQRTNLLLRSEEFDNASWTKSNSTITANATTSLDGYVNADKLITNNAASNGQVNQTISKAATATTYTISAFAKKDEWNQAYLYISDSASFANRLQAFFNIETGTLIQANAFGTFTAASGKIENYGNGWYRISATVTTSTETSILARIYSIDSVATVGDGTSGIFIWGAQLEVGSYPTSYIPTQGSTVTRVAESANIDNLDDYVSSETSWTASGEFVKGQDKDNAKYIFFAYYLASSNLFRIRDFTDSVRFYLFEPSEQSSGHPATLGQTIKWAIRAKSDGAYSVYVDGALLMETSGTFRKLDLCNMQGGNAKTSVNNLKIYNTALTDAELIALTT
jgi:hypothetical protein